MFAITALFRTAVKERSVVMNPAADVEKIDDSIGDESLVGLVLQREDEAAQVRAMKELVRRDSKIRYDVFRRVLADPEYSSRGKRTAVVQLGTESLEENRDLLVKQLYESKAGSIFADAVNSLGKIGGERELKILESIEAPDAPAASRELEFAKSLISYRLRLNRNPVRPPATLEVPKSAELITVKPLKAKADLVKKALGDVKEDLPAIDLSEKGVVHLGCRSTDWLLVFNKEMEKPGAMMSIRESAALPLVLLKRAYSLGHFFLAAYLFTTPKKNGTISVVAIRPHGDIVYAGEASIKKDEFSFKVESVDSRYASAIEFEGGFDPKNSTFRFSRAVSTTQIAGRTDIASAPRPAVPPRR